MSKITPCLWFDGMAEEAANFYSSLLTGRPRSARPHRRRVNTLAVRRVTVLRATCSMHAQLR
jgi:predicted 3-demethylubiquinone-9 3-methyltransferase (glyoxalase superfamily)